MPRIPDIRVGARVTYVPADTTFSDIMLGRSNMDYEARILKLYDSERREVRSIPARLRFAWADIKLSDGTLLKGVPKQEYLNEERARWSRPYVTSMKAQIGRARS